MGCLKGPKGALEVRWLQGAGDMWGDRGAERAGDDKKYSRAYWKS